MTEAESVIADREREYGGFSNTSRTFRAIMSALESGPNWASLPDPIKTAWTMMAQKQARLLNGDPMHADSHLDIEGYARLANASIPRLKPPVLMPAKPKTS